MSNLDVSINLNNELIELKAGIYKGSQLLDLTTLTGNERLHLNLLDEVDIPILKKDLISISGNEVFFIAESNIPDNPKLVSSHVVTVNGNDFEDIDSSKITGENIKKLLSAVTSSTTLYLELASMPDHLIKDDEFLILNDSVKLLLTTQSTSDSDVPDLEECASNNQVPPKHQKYKIKIDKTKYITCSPRLTGREILDLAGHDETRYLYQRFSNAERRLIGLDDKVDFSEPGIERFHTMRCEHTEGDSPFLQRLQFQLPKDDIEFLNSLNLSWECVVESNIKRVIIHEVPLPQGYNVSKVTVNMQIPNSYPTVQIDMAYFSPAISRADNKIINALSEDSFEGKVWQRWSRHRTTSEPWQPGIDCIATHFAYINSWLTSELLK